MTTAILEKCLKILKTTDSDNERLAALLMITKVTKSNDCDDVCMRRIFDAVGLQFLSRLLRTGKDLPGAKSSEKNSSQAFKSVAVNVLSSFCSVPGVIDDPGLTILLPHIAALTVEKSTDEETTQLVSDSYDCLVRIAALQRGPALLIYSKCVPSLCQAIIGKCQAYEKSLQLLLHMCVTCGSDTWIGSDKYLLVIIQQFTSIIDTEMTKEKFDLCGSLATILTSVPENELNKPEYTAWQQVIQKLLFGILQNKLASSHRAMVLRLCSVLIEHYDVQWCLQLDQADSKFLLLLVHLCCIEVRMGLDTEDIKKIIATGSLLVTCYSILEHVILYMSAGPSLKLGAKQISQLHAALVGAFNAIIHFLNRMADHPHCQDVMPIVIASIRVLGAWIAEETTALKQDIIALLPFLIQISRKILSERQHISGSELPSVYAAEAGVPDVCSLREDIELMEVSEPRSSCDLSASSQCDTNASSDKTSSVNPSDIDINSFSSVEVLQFLMPGFCHLSAEDTARKVMLTSDLVHLIYLYLNYQFSRLEQSEKSSLDKEPQMVLTTACGVLLNVVVLERHLVVEKPIFSDILKLCVQKTTQLKDGKADHFVLQYNLMLVSLLIVRQRNEKKDLSKPVMETFFKQCILLLNKVHTSEKGTSTRLCNHGQWFDISEYWKLAMQVMCVIINVFPWLSEVILSTKWLPNMISLLLIVQAKTVEKDVQEAYVELFKTLAKTSSAARSIIKECDGLQLAKKYKWKDLEMLLH